MSANTAPSTEPKRLTRASLIGLAFRIGKVYGGSLLGMRIRVAYERALGCRDVFGEQLITMAKQRGCRPFDNCSGIRVRERRFSPQLRAIREAAARADREAA